MKPSGSPFVGDDPQVLPSIGTMLNYLQHLWEIGLKHHTTHSQIMGI